VTVLGFGTSVPVKTVTKAPTIVTSIQSVVVTSTVTASIITDTFSSTSTIYITETETSSVVSTVTVDSTVSQTVTATSTIAAPAGFLNIQQTSGDTTVNQAKKRAKAPQAHPHAPPPPVNHQTSKNQPPPKGLCGKGQTYPVAVTCKDTIQVHYTETIIFIEPTITKTVPGPTVTSITTATSISTSTVLLEDASVTLSFVATSTDTVSVQTTSYVTTVSVDTQTFTSTSSVYAACATSNMLGPEINGGDHLYQYSPNTGTPTDADVTSAYDCCVACITTDNCLFGVFSTTENICEYVVGASCPAGNPSEGFFDKTSTANVYETTYFNGLCGSVSDENVVVTP